MRRRLSAAIAAATVLLVAFAPVTSAECMTWPLEGDVPPRVEFGFVARVASIEREEMFEEGSGLFRYRITLETARVVRGRVPDTVVLQGTDAGCSFLLVSQLADGERLFIATERLEQGRRTSETELGNVLAWHRTGGQWRFYEDALLYGSELAYYSPAARRATTTADIVRLVSSAPLPDTSTAAPASEPSPSALEPLLVVLFVGTFVVSLRRRSRRGRADPTWAWAHDDFARTSASPAARVHSVAFGRPS